MIVQKTPRTPIERTEQVFNVSFETWLIGIDSKYFTFEPRCLTSVPDKFIWIIEAEYTQNGLVVIRPGDDLKQKEREGLLAYLKLLEMRIENFQLELDERKKRGVTVLEEPKPMLKAMKWKAEIIEKLEIEAPIEEVPSFKDETPDKFSKLFEGFEGAKVVPAVSGPKSSKNGNKSFKDADLSKEIVN